MQWKQIARRALQDSQYYNCTVIKQTNNNQYEFWNLKILTVDRSRGRRLWNFVRGETSRALSAGSAHNTAQHKIFNDEQLETKNTKQT